MYCIEDMDDVDDIAWWCWCPRIDDIDEVLSVWRYWYYDILSETIFIIVDSRFEMIMQFYEDIIDNNVYDVDTLHVIDGIYGVALRILMISTVLM